MEMVSLYPRLIAAVHSEVGTIGAHPSLSYSVSSKFLYHNPQEYIPLTTTNNPVSVTQHDKNIHISGELTKLAGYLEFRDKIDSKEVLARLRDIGIWVEENILQSSCLCCAINSELPKTIEIVCNHQDIPWELTWINGDFLANKSIQARYTPIAKPLRGESVYNSVPKLAVVIGPSEDLSSASIELNKIRKMFNKKFNADISIFDGTSATKGLMRDILANSNGFDKPYDIIHFIGHGSSYNNQAWLELWDSPFSVGHIPPLVKGNPLIFLNSCYSAATRGSAYQYQIDVLDTFGVRLLTNGASHFIGSFFPISDNTASLFSASFYTNLFSGDPVGMAFFKAKKKLAGIDPLSISYVLYGDPTRRIVHV